MENNFTDENFVLAEVFLLPVIAVTVELPEDE